MANGWDNPADGWESADNSRHAAGPTLMSLAWATKLPIFVGAVLAAVATYVALSTLPPIYAARTQVLLKPASVSAIDLPTGTAEPRVTPAQAQSTVIVMESTDVLRAVAEELDLAERPEFNPALRDPGAVEQLRATLRDAVMELVSPSGPEEASQRIAPDDPLAGVLRDLRKAVTIHVLGESAIVEVRATSRNRRLAAAISDAVAESYIDLQLEEKFESGSRATEWLEGRADTLRAAVQEAEGRVTVFRSEQLDAGGRTVADLEPRLEESTERIARVTTERNDLMARRDDLDRLFQAGSYMSLVPLLDIPSITALHEQFILSSSVLSNLETRFGEHPSTALQRERRDDLLAQLRAEIERAIEAFDLRIEALTLRLAEAEESLNEMRRDLVDRQRAELKLTELEREAEASQEVYHRFLVRLKEVRERNQFQTPDARIVTRADIPVAPAAPQKAKMSGVAGMAGGALALLLMMLLRDNRPRVREVAEVTQLTGVEAVVQLPAMRGRALPLALMHCVRAAPQSQEAEALRWLRYRLRPRTPDATHVVFVTSVRAEESTSSLCLALAETFAANGASTVLVNIDGQADDLVALARGTALKDAPFRYLDYSAYMMQPLDAAEGAGDVAERLRILKRTDVIIINGPSVLRSADALEMSQVADRVLVACNWNDTPSNLLRQGVDMLRGAGARVDAIAMGNVPRRSMKIMAPLPRAARPPKALPAPYG